MDILLENGKSIKVLVIKRGQTYEYYANNIKIGVYSPKSMNENILILQRNIQEELLAQIKDGIDSIGKEQIVQEGERNKNILIYAQEIGIKGIRDITTVKLEDLLKDEELENEDELEETKEELDEQEAETEENEVEEQNNKEELENQEEMEETDELEQLDDEEDKEKKIEKTKASSVSVKQKISLSERADNMHDFRKWLGGKIPQECTDIVVIESSQMGIMKDENGESYKRNSTRYSLAVVDKDGNIEPLQKYIPNLRQRDAAGSNPTELKYQVDKYGNVEKDAILSEYEIADRVLQIDNKEMGRVQLNIGQEEHGGNETMGVQMRDSNSTYATSIGVRSVMGAYESNGQYVVNENLKEAEQHREQNPDCKEMTYEDIDGDLNTKSHNHMEDIDFNKLAIKWGFYKNDEHHSPDAEKAKELLEKEMKKSPDKSQEEIIDDITDDLEEDFGGPGRIA